ncbi:hypothetical protein Taro_054150 [Colocasia esculenta]|uniref:Uncharacterized protein n=1 Tax=Colocasia esculenta TaxID=4460 RepID=A0A843XMS5_COLES|nr:hypothetical protein [Colocasia esculenta]
MLSTGTDSVARSRRLGFLETDFCSRLNEKSLLSFHEPPGLLLFPREGTVPLKDTTTPWIPHQVFFSFPGKKAAHFFYRLRSKPPGTNPSAVLLDTNP